MERRYELRLEQMLAQAEVPTELTRGLSRRLSIFIVPYAKALREPEQRQHAADYMTGLISGLERKTGEAIAYFMTRSGKVFRSSSGTSPGLIGRCWQFWPGRSELNWVSRMP
jgi:hypothetical protein